MLGFIIKVLQNINKDAYKTGILTKITEIVNSISIIQKRLNMGEDEMILKCLSMSMDPALLKILQTQLLS